MSPIARVFINQVEVGSMPVREYEAIVAEVRRNPWLWCAQAWHVVTVVQKLMIEILKLSVFLCFLSVAVAVVFFPSGMEDIVNAMTTATSTGKVEVIQNWIGIIVKISVAIKMASWMLKFLSNDKAVGFEWMFSDVFNDAINCRVRQLLEVPATGSMRVELNSIDAKENWRQDSHWVAHAYPLQQITIKLQGTKHSDRKAIIGQLETVLTRLRAGDEAGHDHDDDFGYEFKVNGESMGPSFFDAPAGSN